MMGDQVLPLSTPGELNILAFGNSLTEGYTDYGTHFHPYAISLKKQLSSLLPDLKINIDVNGQSGDLVLPRLNGNFFQRLQSSCPLVAANRPPKYDLVILLGATNDLGYLVNKPDCASEIFESLKTCYEHVLRSRSSLLCLTVPERAIDHHESGLGKRARQ